MHIHWLQHVPFEGLGTIAAWSAARGHQLSCTRFWAGDALPETKEIDLLIVMGGPMGVHDEELYPWLATEKRFISDVARGGGVILGICLGAQLLAVIFGADVTSNGEKEIGWYPIKRADSIPAGLQEIFPEKIVVFHWHGDTFAVPPRANLLCSSGACRNQGFILGEKIVGLQFHLEMTPEGLTALIDHCRNELQEGAWIQSEDEMRSQANQCRQTNHVMEKILDYLEFQARFGK